MKGLSQLLPVNRIELNPGSRGPAHFQVGKKEISQLPFKKHRLCSFSPLVWRFEEKETKVSLRKKDDCHLKESRQKKVTGGSSLKRKEIESDEDSSQTFVHAV